MIIAIVCPHVTDMQVEERFYTPDALVNIARYEKALGGPLVFEDRTTPEAKMLLRSILEHSMKAPPDTQFTLKLIAPTGCLCSRRQWKSVYRRDSLHEKADLRNMLQGAKSFLLNHFERQDTTFELWMFDPLTGVQIEL